MALKLILREVRKAYEIPCRCLREHAGFKILDMLPRDETPIQSKGAWLRQGLQASGRLLLHLGSVREADELVLVGNYMSLFCVLLNKLHVLHPEGLYWWGFQIRGAESQEKLRRVLRLLYAKNLRFVVFSAYERALYQERMGLPGEAVLYQPYGDWKDTDLERARQMAECGDYYFSGGYSNRDYGALLRAWEHIDRRLIVIGSKNNADLYAYTQHPTNPNVEVLLDTPPEVFDGYLNGARACVLPFKSNTGASGQTVALKCMIVEKPVISARIDAMAEYIRDGETGFLLDDFERELPAVIERLERDPALYARMVKAQTALFESSFSYPVITEHLLSLFAKDAGGEEGA